MKISVDIEDGLHHEVRRIAARDGVTLRALVEEGLRGIVADLADDLPKLSDAAENSTAQQARRLSASDAPRKES